jgi:Asp-tRNA(Asn)/Glu-tRNA(Gln) amidotransferase A subunit family amidase
LRKGEYEGQCNSQLHLALYTPESPNPSVRLAKHDAAFFYNRSMTVPEWTIRALRTALAEDRLTTSELAELAISRANQNAGRNTYLWQDAEWTRFQAARAEAVPRSGGGPFGDGRSALWGIPVSVKDCFDLAGAPTTIGTRFYGELGGRVQRDSWLIEQLRAAGAVIVGKTHLHPLAYGITGENPEFGDCVMPGDPGALTGGSSSGGVASVVEGSAVLAIGTDTGGSIRTPAALAGLAGYRATLGRGDWRGGAHLAESFDTMGWLFRDLEDAPLLAAPFAPANARPAQRFKRFAVISAEFLYDCEPEIASHLESVADELQSLGLERKIFEAGWWAEAMKIFAPIQAWEAARIHAGKFDRIQPNIRERLEWGARISDSEICALREQHKDFRERMDDLFAANELLLLPATPVARLAAGADHSQTRAKVLRYTTPISLDGAPAVAIPCAQGGMQLAAARDNDESLLALAAEIGARRNARNPDFRKLAERAASTGSPFC